MKHNRIECVAFIERVFDEMGQEHSISNLDRTTPHKTYKSVAKKLLLGCYAYVRVEAANTKVNIPGFATLGYGQVRKTKTAWTEPKFLASEY